MDVWVVTLTTKSRAHLHKMTRFLFDRASLHFHKATSCAINRLEMLDYEVIKREPLESFKDSLVSALGKISNECCVNLAETLVLFMEDDDYYTPDHITKTVELFEDGIDIVGQGHNRYYNVPYAKYFTHQNDKHSSLCSTAIRASVVPEFLEIIEQANGPLVDMTLWRKLYKEGRGKIDCNLNTCIGLKGMCKVGLGPGHGDKINKHRKYVDDEDRSVMREWLGADYELVRDVYEDGSGCRLFLIHRNNN